MGKGKKDTSADGVEARPQHEGQDPLAGGERLYNESNTEATTEYNTVGDGDADKLAEEHNAQMSQDTTDNDL